MRTLAPAALLAGALLVPQPASAATAQAFNGEVVINCFGCGLSSGTASLSFAPFGSATASFTVDAPPWLCPVAFQARGAVSGAFDAPTFNWTVYGDAMLISVYDGQRTYSGAGTFRITSPVGNPCGGPVTATVTGTFATAAP